MKTVLFSFTTARIKLYTRLMRSLKEIHGSGPAHTALAVGPRARRSARRIFPRSDHACRAEAGRNFRSPPIILDPLRDRSSNFTVDTQTKTLFLD